MKAVSIAVLSFITQPAIAIMASSTLPIVTSPFLSPLGSMTLAAHAQGLVGVWFDGQKHQPDLSAWAVVKRHPVLDHAKALLHAYFSGQSTDWDVPIDVIGGTDFQRLVWNQLRRIPTGQTATYAGIAHAIGRPKAVRAVGSAIGRNPLSIVIPCHRVIGSNGALTGYAGGIERKIALLKLESTL